MDNGASLPAYTGRFRDREVWDIDILYLISIFRSVIHLIFTGSPLIAETVTPDQPLPYRYVEPQSLTLPRLSSYIPFLRMCHLSVTQHLTTFTAGLFDVRIMDEMDAVSLDRIFEPISGTCRNISLYYTLLDRNDRCKSMFCCSSFQVLNPLQAALQISLSSSLTFGLLHCSSPSTRRNANWQTHPSGHSQRKFCPPCSL